MGVTVTSPVGVIVVDTSGTVVDTRPTPDFGLGFGLTFGGSRVVVGSDWVTVVAGSLHPQFGQHLGHTG